MTFSQPPKRSYLATKILKFHSGVQKLKPFYCNYCEAFFSLSPSLNPCMEFQNFFGKTTSFQALYKSHFMIFFQKCLSLNKIFILTPFNAHTNFWLIFLQFTVWVHLKFKTPCYSASCLESESKQIKISPVPSSSKCCSQIMNFQKNNPFVYQIWGAFCGLQKLV